ncbi:MAG TPA: hypothetical protein VIW94_05950 [Acidimicrobiia bacterium]
MTHAAVRRRRGGSWAFPVATIVAIWLSSLLGIVSRSVVVDFISWWPIWALLLVAGFAGRGRKWGKFKLSGLVSITATVLLVVFLIGHFQGWSMMPSAQGELTGGSDSGVNTAEISARVGDGALRLTAGFEGTLYVAGPQRSGGSTALPQALERAQDDTVSVALTPVEDPGWYLFKGWNVSISPLPHWGINLEGSVDADLTGLQVDSLHVEGTGLVILPPTNGNVPVTVDGEFTIDVPSGQPVRVIGPAEVPNDWTRNEDGILSPTTGDGWIISIADGSVVRIRTY